VEEGVFIKDAQREYSVTHRDDGAAGLPLPSEKEKRRVIAETA
jgi:hypothetical protein